MQTAEKMAADIVDELTIEAAYQAAEVDVSKKPSDAAIQETIAPLETQFKEDDHQFDQVKDYNSEYFLKELTYQNDQHRSWKEKL